MFNFGISPRIKSKKAKPIVNPFRLKPISKPRYVGQVKLGVGIPRPPYKRTQSERSLIRKNPWGDRDGDGVPNWIDCKPYDRMKQGLKTPKERREFWEKYDRDPKFHKKIKTAMTKNLRGAVERYADKAAQDAQEEAEWEDEDEDTLLYQYYNKENQKRNKIK